MEDGGVLLRLQAADLQCTVCMGYYNCPCTLPCGHTFCRDCIERCWGDHYICPICQRDFPSRPELSKNTDLAALLEALQAQEPRSHDNCPNCTGPGATKLCLPCMAPLCAQHQLLHRPDSATRRHLLVTLHSAGWPCRGHERGLQYFCIAHSAPLCPTCVLQHQECEPEPLLEVYRRNRERLEKRICDLDENITSKEEATTNQRNAYREIQILISSMKDSLTQDFRDMRDYLEKQERASFWRMQQEQEMAKKATSQDVQILMADMESLVKEKVELEDRMENDWIAVLKDSGSGGPRVSAPPPNKRYTFDENRLVDTTEVISRIRTSLLSHPLLEQVPCPPKQVFEDTLVSPAPPGPHVQMPSTKLPERGLNRLVQWATPITFDPQTVNNRLTLSEDLKTVTVTTKMKVYEKSGRRLTTSQVLAFPPFSSQCHYWEVSTKDSDGWGVGAAAPEMGRDGRLGRDAFSWCVEWRKDQLCAWHNNQGVPILLPRPLNVGVLLHHPDLKFYSISQDVPTLLHTFHLPFQGLIFPAVWLYGLKAGNSLTIPDLPRISMT